MLDLSWNNLVHSNTINFVVLAVALYFILAPVVKKSVHEMTENTVKTVNDSENDKQQAYKTLDLTQKDYAKTPQETSDIIDTALNTLKSLEKKAVEDTEKVKKILEDNAEKAIKSEVARISSALTRETAEHSVTTALNNIKSKLQQDENLHDKLIEQSINELDIV